MKDHVLGYTICVMHTGRRQACCGFIDVLVQLYITLHVNICMGRRQAYFDKHFGPIEN